MRALSLDFERNAPGARLGYGLIASGGLMAAVVLGTQLLVYQEIGRYGEIAPAAVGVRGESPLPRGVASEAEAVAGARAVVAHLTGPWETLFKTLEAIDSPDVALLALTPDMQAHKIRIYAEARSFTAMLSYYSALEQTRAFGEVALVDHEIQQSDPQRPVRFSMTAAWGGG